MKLFDWFGKKADRQPPRETEEESRTEELAPYSGMRVEVTVPEGAAAPEGRLLFVAKLLGLHGSQAVLQPYSEVAVSRESEPLRVRIRGYSDHERKAVYLEGVITPASKDTWAVEELKVSRTGNDRAFFRLSTNLEATATMFSGLEMGEKPCRLLNISVGGASIRSECRYHKGDKFLLKVRLLEDRPVSAIFAQVMRVIEKGDSKFEYGCQFLELTEDDQEKITQNIFAAQRQQRSRT